MTTIDPIAYNTVSQPGAAPTAGPTGTGSAGSTAAIPGTQLTSQDFLDLLSAQLEYQDPLSPTSSSQLMSQTTSLESLEELTSLTSDVSVLLRSSQANQATALIGKTVTGSAPDGSTVTGVVTGVDYASSGPVLTIGSDSLPLADITQAT
jgi:flagellar basal-body rod modification protein FlgD